MKRNRLKSAEVAAYANCLAAERRKHAEEVSNLWASVAVYEERMEELAAALGISVDAEDWWDTSSQQKHDKLMGRASILRGLRKGP